MAISLARRMHEADAALRLGKEFKGDNHDAFLLHGKPLAIVGLGELAGALLPLLRPFSRKSWCMTRGCIRRCCANLT